MTLSDLTNELSRAVQCAFPNKDRSRYTHVFVLLMRWEIGDPKLPVEIEIEQLRGVFSDMFHFEVETFEIPQIGSHNKTNEKISDFVKYHGNSKNDLKIVYYGGHSTRDVYKNLIFCK